MVCTDDTAAMPSDTVKHSLDQRKHMGLARKRPHERKLRMVMQQDS